MADILDKIVEVKHQEVAAARKRKPLAVVRADAESRVLTRDFVGAIRAKMAAGKPAVIAEIKKPARPRACCGPTSFPPTSPRAMRSLGRPACRC